MDETLRRTPSRHVLSDLGFSLTELLTVIAIIGVASAIAIPNFLSRRDDLHLKAASKDIYSNIQRAKMTAIKENNDWAMTINEAANTYTFFSNDGGDGTWNDGNESLASSVNLSNQPGGILFNDPAGGTSSPLIVLRANGTCQPGNIYLSNRKNIIFYRIQTSPACGLTLTRWSGAGWI